MKVFITFLFIVSSVFASAIHEYAPPIVVKEAKVTTGVSSQSRAQDNQGNYAFAYKEDHATGGTFRKESGNALGQVIGSYGLRDIDGRVRIVNYVADDVHGFRASIATNEPGTAAQAPAATSISSPGIVAAAPAVHAPVAVEPAIHAPIAAEPAVHAAPIAAEPLVAHQSAQVVENHPQQQVVVAQAPIAYAQAPVQYAPQAIAQAPVEYAPQAIAQVPSTLIKSYASSIYGPSLLTDNIIFGGARAIPAEVNSYVASPSYAHAPVTNINALHTEDGYYEPTHIYNNPSSLVLL